MGVNNMAYQALYRKYRPVTFNEVVGQNVVKQTLLNTLKSGKVSHAYLFSGPRGTGKTTMAKLFAKAVNCSNPQEGNPCLECSQCLAASKRECPDIIEIDAASNNGVDEIRELRNKVSLVPTELKYKVYIIDEVHMLSIGAFNALLKTLEEPPSHVIFILATTDLHKVPITIVSRCQCFNFKRIDEKAIVNRLKEITSLEKIKIDEDVLVEIARYSDGGMRDALGLLDKLTSYSNNKITMNDMREVNGLMSFEEIDTFIQKVKEQDNEYVLEQLDKMYQNGKDLLRFVEDLMLHLRNQLVKKYIDHQNDIDTEFINQFVIALNQMLNELKESSNIKLLLEIKLLQFMNLKEQTKTSVNKEVEENKQKFDKKENPKEVEIEEKQSPIPESKSIGENQIPKEEAPEPIEENEPKIDIASQKRLRINNTFALADKKSLTELKNNWNKIMEYTLDRKIGAVACFLADATPVAASSKNVILAFQYDSLVERGDDMIEKIENTFKEIFDKDYKIVLLSVDQWKKEKENYIKNIKDHVEYKYQEEPDTFSESTIEPEKEMPTSDLMKEAIQLFGKNIVQMDE